MVYQMMRARSLSVLFAMAAMLFAASAAAATSVQADHVTVSIALEAPAQPGKTVWAAIHQAIAPGWHTYWLNPGDSGLATKVTWNLPKGMSAGAPVWPVPQRFVDDGIVNYGYAGKATLLIPLKSAPGAKTGTAQAHIFLLECEHMCIPENITLDLDLTKSSGTRALFAETRGHIPQTFDGSANLQTNSKTVTVTMNVPDLSKADAKAVRFFPATQDAIDYDAPAHTQIKDGTLTWTAARDPHARKIELLTGILVLPHKGAFIVSASPATPAPLRSENTTLIESALLAFIGGLILNLMPCVLPVLSMKALALGQSGGNARSLRRDGVFYFTGVLATFVIIGGMLVALKSGGAAIGWGFQLQSPLVTFALALLMTAIGLNLLGAFETPLNLAGIGDHLTRGEDGRSAFFTGALAVVVASPCTAPFMGTALGFALTQSAPAAIAVFLALGAGFALPFTALAFTPRLVHLVPKPGRWMLGVKEFLAFPMFATAIWLFWVLSRQTGPDGIALALSVALGAAFLLWLLPHLPPLMRRFAGFAGFAGLIVLSLNIHQAPPRETADGVWQPWSEQAVLDARKAGRPVLVDFSAAWCVTCLVNERVALNDEAVMARLRKENVLLLRGDWTNHNAAIASELARYGRSGVPLYLLYPRGKDASAILLPQILTPSLVLSALVRV